MAILAALFKHVPTVGLPQNFAQKYVLKFIITTSSKNFMKIDKSNKKLCEVKNTCFDGNCHYIYQNDDHIICKPLVVKTIKDLE